MQYYILLKGQDKTKKIIDIHGVKINVEWRKGDTRTFNDCDVKTPMTADYGYIKQSTGVDGDKTDCYIGSNHKSKKVFRLSQMTKEDEFDEYKYMLGYDNVVQAMRSYLTMMPKEFYGMMREITWEEFMGLFTEKNMKKSIGVGIGAGINYIIGDKGGTNEGVRERFKEAVRSGKNKKKFLIIKNNKKKGGTTRLPDGSGFFVGTVGNKKKGGKLYVRN